MKQMTETQEQYNVTKKILRKTHSAIFHVSKLTKHAQ